MSTDPRSRSGTPCAEPGCTGTVVQGYCDECGVAPRRLVTTPSPGSAAPAPVAAGVTVATGVARPRTTRRTVSALRQRLAGLVELPAVEDDDPTAAVIADPSVAEHRRFCANRSCGAPVGRTHDGVPGLIEGYCPRCRAPFSFRPKLAPGTLVHGQYEVVGCIAYGGLGWIHLARDRNVSDKWVVLKGLLDTADPDARAAALAEGRFLAEIDHPNIVRIINVVEHDRDAYIVMEYVAGTSLGAVLEQRKRANGDVADPLAVSLAIAYTLEILPAFGHLHRAGLLYCDYKPENVIRTNTGVKLIDLGAAYRVDEPTGTVFGTNGYQAPEIETQGPSVASDLYTVGRTLAVLCTTFDHQQTHRFTLPDATHDPVFARYEALHAFLLRATAPDPADRFPSADAMADQLFGVLRQVVAEETGQAVPGTSEVFTVELRAATDGPDARALPALLVDTDDPAAGFLASLPATSDDATIALLAGAPVRSVEVELRHARLLVDAGRTAEAGAVLDHVDARFPSEWRVSWYRGLARLVDGDPAGALTELDTTRRRLPGELAPMLGIAFAHELAGSWDDAERGYDLVSRTDPAFVSAAFGLARCRLAAHDVPGALAAYGRVPDTSSAFVAAQAAAADAVLAGGATLGPDELEGAARAVEHLPQGSEARASLEARLLAAALDVLGRHGAAACPARLLGHPFTEPDLRFALERAYRVRARFATTASARIELVDRANAARPRTLL